jgi:hypothetical protein
MVEIPPLNHIYLWSGWIDKLNAPRVEARSHPHPLPEVFLRITHISETILSILTKLCLNVPWVILFQRYVRYVWGPKKGSRGGLKWLIILIFKDHTCMTCLFFSFLLIFKTRPNYFDLQLSCCISDAFSIFFSCVCFENGVTEYYNFGFWSNGVNVSCEGHLKYTTCHRTGC